MKGKNRVDDECYLLFNSPIVTFCLAFIFRRWSAIIELSKTFNNVKNMFKRLLFEIFNV